MGLPPAAFLCGIGRYSLANGRYLRTSSRTRRPPQPETGTLAEPQVRAMFDRIAGVYDRLNSVMTAGLHHGWRERAVELAQVGPGSRVLDVATGTGDLAFALARAIGPDGEVVGADFAEQMLEIARRKAAAGAVGPATAHGPLRAGQRAAAAARQRRVRRRDGRLRRAQLLRPRSGPARARARRAARRSRRDPRDDDTAAAAALDLLQAVVRPGRAGARPRGRRPGRLHATYPTRCAASPGREELAARMAAVGLGDIRYVLTAGGIIALHVGTVVA